MSVRLGASRPVSVVPDLPFPQVPRHGERKVGLFVGRTVHGHLDDLWGGMFSLTCLPAGSLSRDLLFEMTFLISKDMFTVYEHAPSF